MKFRKFILIIFCITVFVLSVSVAFAQNVTVAQDTSIYLHGIGRYFTLKSTSDALNQLQINDAGTTFTITTSLTAGHVTVISTEGIDIGGTTGNSLGLLLTTCDVATGSTLKITANTSTAVTVTVTPPAATICTSAGSTTAAVSTGSGGTSPVTTTPTPSPSTTPPPTTQPTFIDISTTGKEKVSQKAVDAIDTVADLMVKEKTLKIAKNSQFNPLNKMTRFFALQVALAISGNSCDSEKINFKACLAAAQENDLLDEKLPKKNITRGQFYEMLLRAIDAPLVSHASIKKSELPKDIRAGTDMARIWITARKYGIAALYAGNKSNVNLAFPKYAGMIFAENALKAKAKMQAGE